MASAVKHTPTRVSAKGDGTYRGVTLLRPATRSQFSIAEIKKAVEDAIANNPEAVARSK